jgi:hypothetical protein
MYNVGELLIFSNEGENVQKFVVAGAISIETIELSISWTDSLDCRVTRLNSCASVSEASKPVPVSLLNNPGYDISLSNAVDDRQFVEQNVAKNRYSRSGGLHDRVHRYDVFIEMMCRIRMIVSPSRS